MSTLVGDAATKTAGGMYSEQINNFQKKLFRVEYAKIKWNEKKYFE